MAIFKLAFRNITHAGLRTWLNVVVLSFAFVLIIWVQGLYEGLQKQVINDMKAIAVGGGQFWQQSYDPYDPLSLEDAHAPLSMELSALVERGEATPVLMTPATIFPEGRVQSVILRGIDPRQNVVALPSFELQNGTPPGVIPAIIGTRMAKSANLQKGDLMTIRWRDANGVFDAAEMQVMHVFSTSVQTIDEGQIWIPLSKLQEMLNVPGQATYVIVKQGLTEIPPGSPDWVYRDHNFLFAELYTIVKTKRAGSSVFLSILFAMALLAIFDTQVLSIFRRRKEMGTLMALGMTRWKVIGLFTLEGALQGLLAILVGALYGMPFLAYQSRFGLQMPQAIEQGGWNISAKLYPAYSWKIFLFVTLILFISVVIVSFLPTRRISKLKPTEALRGRAT